MSLTIASTLVKFQNYPGIVGFSRIVELHKVCFFRSICPDGFIPEFTFVSLLFTNSF